VSSHIPGSDSGRRLSKSEGYVKGSNQLRILIADDHEFVRRGLKALLLSKAGWVICAEASNGREAVALATQHRPDIIVMDIAMPGLNGLEATRKIREMLPKSEVLVLSLHYSDQLVREIVDAGARSYLLKSDASTDLLTAVEALARHRSFFTSGAGQVLMDRFRNGDSATTTPPLLREALTTREREILQLLAEGKSSKEVAGTLDISVKTAETHRSNLMRKLNMHSVSELVRYAVKNHMIEP
jgi:DNA-binding NarL/FixJ family response regulator